MTTEKSHLIFRSRNTNVFIEIGFEKGLNWIVHNHVMTHERSSLIQTFLLVYLCTYPFKNGFIFSLQFHNQIQ